MSKSVSKAVPATPSSLNTNNSFHQTLAPPSPHSTASQSSNHNSTASQSNLLSFASGSFNFSNVDPAYSSWLFKKSSSLISRYQRRFMQFYPDYSVLVYSMDSKMDEKSRKVILLNRFALENNAESLKFTLNLPGKIYQFKAENSTEFNQWVELLQSFVNVQTLQNKGETSPENDVKPLNLPVSPKSSNSANSSAEKQEIQLNSKLAASAVHCALCKSSFGLFKSKLLCFSCGLAYCSNCIDKTKEVSPNNGENHEKAGEKEKNSPVCLNCVKTQAESSALQTLKLRAQGSLLINIIEGRDLMAADANGFSDPYVILYVEGAEYRTEVQLKTLNPVWNREFNIPVLFSHNKAIDLAIYDKDQFSKDDFMGFVHIPLNNLENNVVYDDWFVLQPRPGKKADKTIGISGAVRLQLCLSSNIMTLFEPIFYGQQTAEQKFSNTVLKANINRITAIVDSLSLKWWKGAFNDIITYERPVVSLFALLFYIILVLFYPAEWVLPTIPALLLVKLAANWVQNEIVAMKQLETTLKARKAQQVALRKLKATLSDANNDPNSAENIENQKKLRGFIHTEPVNEQESTENGENGNSRAEKRRDPMMEEAAQQLFEQNQEITELLDSLSAENGEDSAQTALAKLNDTELDDLDEENEEEQGKGNFISNMQRQYRALTATLLEVQASMNKICDQIEGIQHLFRWTDKRMSQITAVLLVAAIIALAIVPIRAILLAAGIGKWSKNLKKIIIHRAHLIRTKSSEDEVENFLAHAPTEPALHPDNHHLPKTLGKS
jgi:hypothetical protein